MRIKALFSIPDGKKVTERALRKVLISSICSILLCMYCLISTTWAWFAVSIENTGNIIEIATVAASVDVTAAEVSVTPQGDGSYALDAGRYNITIGLEQLEKTPSSANLLNDSKCPVYVIMTVCHGDDVEYRLFTFDNRENMQNHKLAVGEGSAVVSFSVSWVKPASELLDGSEPVIIGEIPTEPAAESSARETTTPSTEPFTEATTILETEPSTEIVTEPPTEAATEPFTEPSEEPTTELSTEPTTELSTEATTESSTEVAANSAGTAVGTDS